jgi:hypothetical protein
MELGKSLVEFKSELPEDGLDLLVGVGPLQGTHISMKLLEHAVRHSSHLSFSFRKINLVNGQEKENKISPRPWPTNFMVEYLGTIPLPENELL